MAILQKEVSGLKGVPITTFTEISRMQIHVTEKCNLNCTYCYNRGRTEKTMSLELAEKIINWYIEASGRHEVIGMRFMGGEPLVEFERVKEIAALAQEMAAKVGKRFNLQMTTNATLFNDEIMEWAVENQVGMFPSADGNALINDKHRVYPDGRGSWEDIKKALALRNKYFPGKNGIGGTLMPDSAHLVYESIKGMFEEAPIKYIRINPNEMVEWTSEQFKTAREQMLRLKSEGYKVYARDKAYPPYTCGACVDKVIIDLDGAIYSCPRLDDFSDHRPWHEKPYVLGHVDYGITRPELYEDYMKRPERLNARCQKCELPCEGPCPSSCFFYSGNLFDFPSICCQWRKLALELEGLL